MICPNCGAENPGEKRFCGDCGTSLASDCPNCGAWNPPGKRFCGDCGTALSGGDRPAAADAAAGASGDGPRAGSPRAAPAHEAERKLVSVLFADLVGFTPFAEERDAEEVRETLSSYFDLASDVIGRYGGTVEKFIGDAVMAVWGAPIAREDDAERAVRAGLELVDSVRGLGPTIQARAGVLTGQAAVTVGATNEGMVAGDLVNTAARLQSVAPPGAVLVGETTQRAAAQAIAFEPVGDQILKGKTSPVPAWRAMRVVAERGGRNRSDAIEAPFVGRDDELRMLKDLFHATGRESRLRLVSVVGPAGIGKSRLAWEFLKYIDGLVENVWWHDGRSPAYGEGISFWALGEMVRGRCGLLETDDEATTRAKVTEALAQHVPDADERAWIEPALLTLLGLESGAGSEQLFAAWRTFFERLAAESPVVMIFEDLHFADSGLLDFIDHLLDWSRGLPIYVVTLARPELLEKRSNWGAGKRNFVSIYLEPLPEPAMRELLAGLVPGLPEAAIRTIVERAGGIPLYAVETVRMLVAEGRLTLQGDAYVPTGDLGGLAIPETLTALIAARLDALDPADRALVQDAAVLGQSFTTAGLSAVAGVPESELEPRLRSLARRELLTLQADPRSPERGQFAFVQALIREVAYNTLAKRDRKVRHLAAARFFEGLGTDELAGALAGHYLAAHANAPEGEEADALAGQARIALAAAAERAAALGAHDQAVAFLEQAIDVAAAPADQAALLERAAVSATTAAHYSRGEALARRAVEIYQASGDADAAARATTVLAAAMIDGSDLEASLGLLEDALKASEGKVSPEARARLLSSLGRVYMRLSRYAEGAAAADQALALAEPLRLDDVVAEAMVNRASSISGVGRIREAVALMRAAIDLARLAGLASLELRATNNLGASVWADEPRASWDAGRAALGLAERVGDQQMSRWLRSANAMTAFGFAADWDSELRVLDELLSEDLEENDRVSALAVSLWFRFARGEGSDAGLAAVDAAVAEMSNPQPRFMAAWAHVMHGVASGDFNEISVYGERVLLIDPADPIPTYYLGRMALWNRDPEGLRGSIANIEATPTGRQAVPRAQTATLVAGLAALEGRTTEALALYREAVRAWEAIDQEWDLAMCGIDMATVLDPSIPDVRAASDKARMIFTRVGAKPYLAKLDALLARRPAATVQDRTAESPPVPAADLAV